MRPGGGGGAVGVIDDEASQWMRTAPSRRLYALSNNSGGLI